MRLALVGNLANDLDNDVRLGALGIDVGNADLGVLEVETLDALVDGLSASVEGVFLDLREPYLLSYTNVDLLLFNAGDVLRTLVVEELGETLAMRRDWLPIDEQDLRIGARGSC